MRHQHQRIHIDRIRAMVRNMPERDMEPPDEDGYCPICGAVAGDCEDRDGHREHWMTRQERRDDLDAEAGDTARDARGDR